MIDKKSVHWIVLLAVFVAIAACALVQIRFDWTSLWSQLRSLQLAKVAAAAALIYASVALRAFRWAVLLKPTKRVESVQLISSQFVGFTCVALFGSLGDLVRPYLMARRTGIPVSSLIATYTIERAFDVGAAAAMFLASLGFAASGTVKSRHTLMHAGALGVFAMLAILVVSMVVRKSATPVANWTERRLRLRAPRLAHQVAARIRLFSNGMHAITSWRDLLKIAAISLTIWGLIAEAFAQVVGAFVNTPALSTMSFAQSMMLVAASIGGSLVQFPVVGWFTQIAALAVTMHVALNVPVEPATACGALLLSATFLFLIPAGMLCAWTNGLTIRTTLRLIARVEN